jgi:hypothetical protein
MAKKKGKQARVVVAADADAAILLRELVATAGELTTQEREQLVDQALVLIEQAYVHLPLKQAMHGVDPIQRLKLLGQRLDQLSERQFHQELLSIFVELRDLHTNYLLPDPYSGRTAFLPFLMEEFFQDGTPRLMVSKLRAGFSDPHFVPGVEVTYWNGVPIDRAVEVNAARQAGGNPDARHAQALEAMTIRPLGFSAPPDEEWVVIGFTDGQTEREIRIDWRVFQPEPSPSGVDPDAWRDPAAAALGLDARTEAVRRAKKLLFAPHAVEAERQMAGLAADGATGRAADALGDQLDTTSLLPDNLSFRPVTTPHGEFGYIRIWSFNVDDYQLFLHEFVRMAGLLPQNGLVVDVRGNGGGLLVAGEFLLQLLTPRTIDPARLHFINTPLTLLLAKHQSSLGGWLDSIRRAVETGEVYSQGFPIAPIQEYNRLGQHYFGPVVLVTDALCYSTTDIFAAGFQDHEIGQILGTSGNTGAGGANVWTHEFLRRVLPAAGSPLTRLPGNASFRVAIRRTTRVGARAGVPVEDLGVVPDARHQMTRNDLTNNNEDLIAAAAALLLKAKAYGLAVRADPPADGRLLITATTKGLDRIDLLVDDRPRHTVDVQDGTTVIELPLPTAGASTLQLRGFDQGKLVAARQIQL